MRSSNRGQAAIEPMPIIITTMIALAVASVGVAFVDQFDEQEWSENREHFERYCTERFGEDAHVYIGGGQGVHSGLHCEDSEHKPIHLGAVEPSTWEAYKNGEANADDVTRSMRDVGFMGTVGGHGQHLVSAVVVVVGVGGIGLVRLYRNRD